MSNFKRKIDDNIEFVSYTSEYIRSRVHNDTFIHKFDIFNGVEERSQKTSLKNIHLLKKVFEKINSPADLKELTHQELLILSKELRDIIFDITCKNGGHLASNLGAIELTIAIHRVFNCPEDKIIWDVGHQSYAHKLLTERKKQFSSLRQLGGISGFPCRFESIYDAFTAGHAGNSISAGVGMALARDLSGYENNVVTVIGDGSLTSGMALEAINHLGSLGLKLIIVLNDNGMSISKSIGALSCVLNEARLNPDQERFSKKTNNNSINFESKKNLNGLAVSTFWENLGFKYLGPVNGHDILELESAFINANDFSLKPVIVHVKTIKGKGIYEIENNVIKYHSVPSKKI